MPLPPGFAKSNGRIEATQIDIATKLAGRIKEVLDIKTVRDTERWNRFQRIEDVMDLDSFIHLRTHVWKSLREEKREDRP